MRFDLADDLMYGPEGLRDVIAYNFSVIELIIREILLAALIFADLPNPANWKILSDPEEELLELGGLLLRLLILSGEQFLQKFLDVLTRGLTASADKGEQVIVHLRSFRKYIIRKAD